MSTIRYLKYENIDLVKWDKCVAEAPNARVYAMSWYLNAVCLKWDAIIVGDYFAVMPLPIVKKYGLEMLITPFMVQQLGIFSNVDLNQILVDQIIDAIPGKFNRIHLNFNEANDFHFKNFTKTAAPNFELPLYDDYETIKKRYNKNTKRNIKKSNIIEWQYVLNIQPENCVQLFKENKGKELKQNINFYQNVLKVMNQSIQSGYGKLFGLYESNSLCACAFYIFFKNRIYNLFPVSNEFGKKNGAMFAILDKIIQENSMSDYILDFEGSKVEGVARFYKGFGAEKKNYWTIERNRLPFYWKLLMKMKNS